jgi:hypothetical protein
MDLPPDLHGGVPELRAKNADKARMLMIAFIMCDVCVASYENYDIKYWSADFHC